MSSATVRASSPRSRQYPIGPIHKQDVWRHEFRVCEFWYKRCCGKPRSLAPLGSIGLFSQLPPSLSHFFQSHTVPFRLGFLSETVAFLRKL
jgi:hypothetical protein